MKRPHACLALVVAATAGCTGASTAPDTIDFEATVSGDLMRTLQGRAVFGVGMEQGQSGFVIAMTTGELRANDSDVILIGRDNPQPPAAGTYAIESAFCQTCTADDFAVIYLHQVTSADFGIFLSIGGSMTLTAVGAERLVGSFTFAAVAVRVSGTVSAQNLALAGSFMALPGEIPSLGQ